MTDLCNVVNNIPYVGTFLCDLYKMVMGNNLISQMIFLAFVVFVIIAAFRVIFK